MDGQVVLGMLPAVQAQVIFYQTIFLSDLQGTEKDGQKNLSVFGFATDNLFCLTTVATCYFLPVIFNPELYGGKLSGVRKRA